MDTKKIRTLYICKRCGYHWFSKKEPTVCADCHSPYWNKERKIKQKNIKCQNQ